MRRDAIRAATMQRSCALTERGRLRRSYVRCSSAPGFGKQQADIIAPPIGLFFCTFQETDGAM
jgi:hypothetical protein